VSALIARAAVMALETGDTDSEGWGGQAAIHKAATSICYVNVLFYCL
jgi:hypothetical protein